MTTIKSKIITYHSFIDTAGTLLLKVKKNEPVGQELYFLANTYYQDIMNVLDNDAAKKCFWINIYNSYFQLMANDSNILRNKIFKIKKIALAGLNLSLDDVEHGILRHYRWKWSLGYMSDPFTHGHIKQLAVERLDYRIHFALNCGATSCPPIAFYTLLDLEQQLETAMMSFIENETTIDQQNKVIRTSRLLQWYIGDFGGKTGILKLLGNVFDQNLSTYDIIYNPYNWDIQLANFSPI